MKERGDGRDASSSPSSRAATAPSHTASATLLLARLGSELSSSGGGAQTCVSGASRLARLVDLARRPLSPCSRSHPHSSLARPPYRRGGSDSTPCVVAQTKEAHGVSTVLLVDLVLSILALPSSPVRSAALHRPPGCPQVRRGACDDRSRSPDKDCATSTTTTSQRRALRLRLRVRNDAPADNGAFPRRSCPSPAFTALSLPPSPRREALGAAPTRPAPSCAFDPFSAHDDPASAKCTSTPSAISSAGELGRSGESGGPSEGSAAGPGRSRVERRVDQDDEGRRDVMSAV